MNQDNATRAAGSSAPACSAGFRVRPIIAWYDFWVGAFWDGNKRRLYILPIPCVGIVIHFPPNATAHVRAVASNVQQIVVCSGTGVSDCASAATHEVETWHGGKWRPACKTHAEYFQSTGRAVRLIADNDAAQGGDDLRLLPNDKAEFSERSEASER